MSTSVSLCPHAESTVGVSPSVAWVPLLTFHIASQLLHVTDTGLVPEVPCIEPTQVGANDLCEVPCIGPTQKIELFYVPLM